MIPGWWAARVLENHGPIYLAAWCIWMILSITLHELAHGWAAIRRGDPTPIETGHMTFNPVVHMGVNSLLIFALCGIAWGAMPINPYRLRGKYGHAYVAFAGPLMNFGLATLCVILAALLGGLAKAGITPRADVADQIVMFFWVGSSLNIALGLFNLLPIMPMDGGRILANFSRTYEEFTQTQAGQFVSAASFVLAFFFAGKLVFGVGYSVTDWCVNNLVSLYPTASVP